LIFDLLRIVRRTIEALRFFSFVPNLSGNKQLQKTSFYEFVTTVQGKLISSGLIRGLAYDNLPLPSLCPSFCDEIDVGLEELSNAQNVQGKQRLNMVDSAYGKISLAIQKTEWVYFEKLLPECCLALEKLGFSKHALDLTLLAAQVYRSNKSARDNCYRIGTGLVDRGIPAEKALGGSEDVDWHHAVYTHLLQSNPQSLLDIKADTILDWLRENQSDLLATWLARHQMHAQAVVAYRNKALVDRRHIDERVNFYTRALIQAKAAITPTSSRVNEEDADIDLHQIQDEFDLLKLQKEVCDALQDEEDLDIRYKIVNCSTLYNDYAYKYGLWEQCLAILQSVAMNDPEELKTLYINIIQDQPMDVLKGRLEKLGKRFLSTGQFPCEFLVKQLEDGSVATETQKWNPWVVETLLSAGVSCMELLDIYWEIFDTCTSDRSKIMVATALLYIVNQAKVGDESRGIQERLERLSVIVSGLHGDGVSQAERESIKNDISTLLSTLDA